VPVLGVGWDVGGWVGKKQGVAVIGDDLRWLETPTCFSLRQLPADWSLLDLIRLGWPEAHELTLENFEIVLAVDAPFGFPRAFQDLLAGRPVPTFPASGPEIDNPFAYRDTDREIFRVFNKKPLSASFDKLGNNATVAMVHVHRLARLHGARVPPFTEPRAGTPTIIEVYPALTKQKRKCHPRIASLLPDGLVEDAYDASICAILALAFALRDECVPELVGPSAEQLSPAQTEGWIYYAAPAWF
jgi:hypothetical protein